VAHSNEAKIGEEPDRYRHLVRAGAKIPAKFLAAGVPAKIRRNSLEDRRDADLSMPSESFC
jgi:hypothetical protein